MSDVTPPSFAPRAQRPRPDAGAATPVGSGSPETRPAPPRSSAAGQRSSAAGPPPSIPPRTSATRPASPVAGAPARPATVPPRGTRAPGAGRPASSPPPGHAPRRAAAPATPAGARPVRRVRRRRVLTGVAAVLVLALAWPVGLAVWGDGRIQHVEALSGAPDTPGTTYLLTGSDSRGDGAIPEDGTEGMRTDTILVLHVPESGPAALISLPRDTYVQLPEIGDAKLNAAYVFGGPALLVATVEQLTGLTVDHYAEIGMAGLTSVVDAVGGVELCYDADVFDTDSGLAWEAGCHVAPGDQALAFARMRKSDPKGDIGRAERQRQVIARVAEAVVEPDLLWHPGRQVTLVRAGTDALTLDAEASAMDLARLALAFRSATGPEGITGTPPIASIDYHPSDIGSAVLLDPDQTPQFFVSIRDGLLPAGPVGGMPTG